MIYLPLNNIYFHSIVTNIVYLAYQEPETEVLTNMLTSLNECIQVITQIGECLGTLLKWFKSSFLSYFDELVSFITPMLVRIHMWHWNKCFFIHVIIKICIMLQLVVLYVTTYKIKQHYWYLGIYYYKIVGCILKACYLFLLHILQGKY